MAFAAITFYRPSGTICLLVLKVEPLRVIYSFESQESYPRGTRFSYTLFDGVTYPVEYGERMVKAPNFVNEYRTFLVRLRNFQHPPKSVIYFSVIA